MLTGFLEAVFNGISIGAVLLIAALGLAIIFGLMGVINMAHGELMMFGAYATFVVQNVCKQLGGVWFELYIFLALIVAFIFTAAVGLILEKGVIRYLYGRPLETLLATWGVSLIFQQFVRSVNWDLGSKFDFSTVCPQRELGINNWHRNIFFVVYWRFMGFKFPHKFG